MSWAGTVLKIDLTEKKSQRFATSTYAGDYLGGRGLGAKIIYDEVPPDVQALDPGNVVTFNAGVLTGTAWANKCEVMTKSPQTVHNILCTAGMGGQFACEMKFAGYDSIVIKGKADAPVYLYINNHEVEIKGAQHLWGLDVHETQTAIKQELDDPDVQIACIGPAGENQVAYSVILHEINNTASRSGAGAVMGSKNLKAVVVRGTKGVKVADPEAFMSLFREYYANLTMRPQRSYPQGVAADFAAEAEGMMWGHEETTICPPIPSDQTAMALWEKYGVRSHGCAFCPNQCFSEYDVPGVGSGGAVCGDYWCFHWGLKTHDQDLWLKAVLLCDRYGIDVVSMNSIVSWLMRLYEKGIITAADTDGVPMEWAGKEATLTAIEKVARREGFGKTIADGILPACRKIGKGSSKYARQTKGVDYWTAFPWPSNALALAVAIGGGHVQASPYVEAATDYVELTCQELYPEFGEGWAKAVFTEFRESSSETITGDKNAWQLLDEKGEVRYEGKAQLMLAIEDLVTLADMLGYCDFLHGAKGLQPITPTAERMATVLNAATGRKYTGEMLHDAVFRVRLLERSYDYLCGMRREDEVLADSLCEPIKTNKWGTKIFYPRDRFEQLKSEYYELRGCDPETGVPAREELERLGLKEVADRLAKLDFEGKSAPADEASVKKS